MMTSWLASLSNSRALGSYSWSGRNCLQSSTERSKGNPPQHSVPLRTESKVP